MMQPPNLHGTTSAICYWSMHSKRSTRFRRKGHRLHHTVREGEGHTDKTECGMGDIAVANFGECNLSHHLFSLA